jgi:predicted ArsR family transcriptional regulator
MRLLTERGYEPRTDASGRTWLANCVFDELANQDRQLVCGMNFSLVSGILDALPETGLEARFEPGNGRCCVVLAVKEPDHV